MATVVAAPSSGVAMPEAGHCSLMCWRRTIVTTCRCTIRHRSVRAPLMMGLQSWLEIVVTRVSGRSDLAGAIRYALSCWDAISLVPRDGRASIELAAERATRPVALSRRN